MGQARPLIRAKGDVFGKQPKFFIAEFFFFEWRGKGDLKEF